MDYFTRFNLFNLASFIFILRYQSSIPTTENFSYHFITSSINYITNCLVPYLIVRLKALWLFLFTVITCLAFVAIFQWPKLQYDACHITFDALPLDKPSKIYENSLNNIDIDITYYIGSDWEVPNEPLIPLRDIPVVSYNFESRMTSIPDDIGSFTYALKQNISQLIQFCSSLSYQTNKKYDDSSISLNFYENSSITR